MKKPIGVLAVSLLMSLPASAAPVVELFEWSFNVTKDGTTNFYDCVPSAGGCPVFQFVPPQFGAQGTLQATFTGAGNYVFAAFYDYELYDVAVDGGSFTNEYGQVAGAPGAGVSWEIDEPGYVFGDIFSHVSATPPGLDNTNAINLGAFPNGDDVSFAMARAFVLAANEEAILQITISETAPGGFYLQQSDLSTSQNLYFYTAMQIRDIGGEPEIPEPATYISFLIGAAALIGIHLGRRFKQAR